MEVDAFSVYRAFEQIQDGRHKRGVRYSSALILTLIVLAKLAGMTRLGRDSRVGAVTRRVAEPGAAQPREAAFPAQRTHSNVVRTLDAQQVRQVLNDLPRRLGARARC